MARPTTGRWGNSEMAKIAKRARLFCCRPRGDGKARRENWSLASSLPLPCPIYSLFSWNERADGSSGWGSGAGASPFHSFPRFPLRTSSCGARESILASLRNALEGPCARLGVAQPGGPQGRKFLDRGESLPPGKGPGDPGARVIERLYKRGVRVLPTSLESLHNGRQTEGRRE